MPGRTVFVQVVPLFPERATAMPLAPPSKKRPVWKAETMVFPNA